MIINSVHQQIVPIINANVPQHWATTYINEMVIDLEGKILYYQNNREL